MIDAPISIFAGQPLASLRGASAADVPVLTGAPLIIDRRITEPFIDRYNDEVLGGDLLFVGVYRFTGDAVFFSVKPEGFDPGSIYASVTPDAVYIKHLTNGTGVPNAITLIAIAPEDLPRLQALSPDEGAGDRIPDHEQRMAKVTADMASRLTHILDHLRDEAAKRAP